MPELISYWYYKKSDREDSEAIAILREQKENTFAVEYWSLDHWENGIDFWWQLRQETCYHDIEENEALEEIKQLSVRHKEAKSRMQKVEKEKLRLKKLADKRKDEDEALNKILADRSAERAKQKEQPGWTALETSAIALHEVFTSLINGGFSENQAIQIVSTVLATVKAGKSKEDEIDF